MWLTHTPLSLLWSSQRMLAYSLSFQAKLSVVNFGYILRAKIHKRVVCVQLHALENNPLIPYGRHKYTNHYSPGVCRYQIWTSIFLQLMMIKYSTYLIQTHWNNNCSPLYVIYLIFNSLLVQNTKGLHLYDKNERWTKRMQPLKLTHYLQDQLRTCLISTVLLPSLNAGAEVTVWTNSQMFSCYLDF